MYVQIQSITKIYFIHTGLKAYNVSMYYDVGTHIDLRQKQPAQITEKSAKKKSDLYVVGTRVVFLKWMPETTTINLVPA